MIRKLAILALALVSFGTIAHAAPAWTYGTSFLPQTTNTYDLGSSSPAKVWRYLYVNNICLSGDCKSAWPSGSGSSFAWPFDIQSWGVSTSSVVGFTNGAIFNASTTLSYLTSGLVGNNNGRLYSFASTSLFGFTPASNAITLTNSSANGQIVIAGGAQDLSASRTWTFTYTGLATTSQPSSSNVLTSNGAAGVYGTATSTLTATSPLTGSFIQLGSGGSLGCQTASGSQAGCLSSTDWSTFNNKQAPGFQIGTSSIAQGNLAYFSSTVPTTLTSVATGTVSAGTGISLDSSVRSVIGGALAITNTGVISASCTGGTTCSGTNPLSISSFSYPFPSNATTTLLLLNGNASTTQLSATKAYFGGTATSTFGTDGALTLPAAAQFNGAGLSSCTGANFLQWSSGLFSCAAASAGSQTPWTSNIDAATFNLANVGTIGIGTSSPFQSALTVDSGTSSTTNTYLTGSVASFLELNIQNRSAAAGASSDFTATADNGTPTTHYANFGINGSGGGSAPFTAANNGYVYTSDDPLNIGAFGANSYVSINTGTASNAAFERFRFLVNGRISTHGSSTPWGMFSINATTTGATAIPQFVIGSSTETVFVVDSDYDTGLSTTSPFAKLSIQSRPGSTSWLFGVGTTSASGANTSATSTLTVGINQFGHFLAGLGGSQVAIGSTSPFAQFSIDASATTSTRVPIFAIGSTSSQALIVTGRSFTGIGTTTPNALLAVNPLASLTTASQFAVGSSSASSFIINNAGLTGVGTSTPWGQFAINPIAGNNARPRLVVGSSTATSFLVANTGRVGLGTTTPFANLSIQGTTAQTAYLFAVSSSTSANAGSSASSTMLWSIDSFGNFFGNLLQRVRFTLGSTSVQNAAFSIDTSATSTPGFDWFNIGSTSSGTLFKVSAPGFVQTGESDIGTGSSTSFALNWGAYKNKILYRTGFSATTISLIQATTSQYAGTSHVLTICNPGGTAGAITIKGCDWAGGTAYTQTTTANQCDAISMYVTQGTSTLASPSYRVFCAANTGFTQTGP